MRITRVAIAVASVLWAGVGSAQGVYVGGAIGAEVVRTTSTRSGGTTYNAGSGEAFAGAIRIGAGITERFGSSSNSSGPVRSKLLGGPIFLGAFENVVAPHLSHPGRPASS